MERERQDHTPSRIKGLQGILSNGFRIANILPHLERWQRGTQPRTFWINYLELGVRSLHRRNSKNLLNLHIANNLNHSLAGQATPPYLSTSRFQDF